MQMVREQFNLLSVNTERNAYLENPDYQRESAVWPLEKRQLLLDSILNDYDIPKIYLHNFRAAFDRGALRYKYAIVDGKQRLSAVWSFLNDEFPLDQSFSFVRARRPGDSTQDVAGKRFSEFDSHWRTHLFSKMIDVVLIDTDDIQDIEELFMRLNNGEPLNAAEKRNAVGGVMCALVRKVAQHPFFLQKVAFSNRRYAHYEASVKLLLIEHSLASTQVMFVDLKKKFLDKLVKDNQSLPDSEVHSLEEKVESQLRRFQAVFSRQDPLLSKQAYIPMYYLFYRDLSQKYRGRTLNSKVKQFLGDFLVLRAEDLEKEEERRDPFLSEFGRLVQQGTNDRSSLERRVDILLSYFLAQFPDSVFPTEPHRVFSPEERAAIWFRGGRKCEICHLDLLLSDMAGDHVTPWIDGGPTTLSNARCLCVPCNAGQVPA
jgi:hypothetical protein